MNIHESLKVFDRITFEEKNHCYFIDGELAGAPSVTKLLKQHKKPFDADAAAEKVAKRERVTAEYIKAKWAAGNLYSSTIGTLLHKYIENFYCNVNESCDVDLTQLTFEHKEMIKKNLPILTSQFKSFHKDHSELEYIKSELIIGDLSDTRVCGMVDMLAYNKKTKKFDIIDFKTNKRMEKENKYREYLLYPFEHLMAGQVNEYTIQLNTYEYILEKNIPDIEIGRKIIVWFNPNNEDYKVVPVHNIQDRIKEMFRLFKTSSLFEET